MTAAWRNHPATLSGLLCLAAEPVVQLLHVFLQPAGVDAGPLQSLLHRQRRHAKAGGATLLLHKLLQLGRNREQDEDRDRDRDREERLRHTCWSSAGVEKRAVVPLMMEEKEKEPTPYLKETRAHGHRGEENLWIRSPMALWPLTL